MAEMKRELKRLQRLREQVRAWIPEVKGDQCEALNDARKEVEREMVRGEEPGKRLGTPARCPGTRALLCAAFQAFNENARPPRTWQCLVHNNRCAARRPRAPRATGGVQVPRARLQDQGVFARGPGAVRGPCPLYPTSARLFRGRCSGCAVPRCYRASSLRT